MNDSQPRVEDHNRDEHERFDRTIILLQEDLKKLFQLVSDSRTDQIKDLSQWQEAQDSKQESFRRDLIDRMDSIKTSLENESYMKNMLLSRIKELKLTIEYWRRKQEQTDDRSKETAIHVQDLKNVLDHYDLPRIKDGVEHANKTLRDHADKIKVLETAPTTELKTSIEKRKEKMDKVKFAFLGGGIGLALWGLQEILKAVLKQGGTP
jgi:CRISPR/Cas system CMR-associated protein Cmr5 small subunit